MIATEAPARILIVDDVPDNIQALSGMLSDHFQIQVARDGEQALALSASDPAPDLILLDVVMPGMDGHEVCRRLKGNPVTREIPIIFVSARGEEEDETEGFSLGAVDYLRKPAAASVAVARVRTHLEIARQQRELEEHNRHLKELEGLRDNLVHMIVHDLRSPLQSLVFGLEMATNEWNPHDPDMRAYVDLAHRAGKEMQEMVASLLDVHRMEAGEVHLEREPTDLGRLCFEVVESMTPIAENRGVKLVCSVQRAVAPVDPALVRRVVQNLVNNAIKFSTREDSVQVILLEEGAQIRVAVVDQGPGIAPGHRETIFEKFGQVAAHREREFRSPGAGADLLQAGSGGARGAYRSGQPGRQGLHLFIHLAGLIRLHYPGMGTFPGVSLRTALRASLLRGLVR